MRVVIFTARPDLEASAFWPVVMAVPGIEQVLLLVHHPQRSIGFVLRSIWRNLRKHGPIYLPYRLLTAVNSALKDPEHPLPLHRTSPLAPTVERLRVPDIHASSVLEHLRRWAPDLGLSIGSPILGSQLFRIPAMGTVNIHGGRVPDFRGAPPGFWELYTGAREVGATLHWMTEKVDAGDVLEEALAPIYPQDSLQQVADRSEELSLYVLERGLKRVVGGSTRAWPQRAGGPAFRFPTLSTRLRLHLTLGFRRSVRWWTSIRNPAKSLVHGFMVYGVRPLRDLVRTVRGTHPVRVFNFHRVTTLVRDGMTVSPRVFRSQVAYISATHRVLPGYEALELVRNRERLRRPVAVITFDDGYASVLERAYPLMRSRKMVGVCFLCTSFLGTDRRYDHDGDSMMRSFLRVMTWKEAGELRTAGWEMGGHTRNHERLSGLTGADLSAEVGGTWEDLRNAFGEPPRLFAYPFGQTSDITDAAVREVAKAGYFAAFQDYGGSMTMDPDWFRLPRIEIGGDHPRLTWKARVHGLNPRALLWKRFSSVGGLNSSTRGPTPSKAEDE